MGSAFNGLYVGPLGSACWGLRIGVCVLGSAYWGLLVGVYVVSAVPVKTRPNLLISLAKLCSLQNTKTKIC